MSTLPERLQWIFDNVKRPDGRLWKAKPLSIAAGLGPMHLGAIVRGEIKNPGEETLRPVAEAAKVSVGWLMSGEGDPFPSSRSHDVGELAPSVDWSAPPTFDALPNWPALLAGAKPLRPQHPAWVWDKLAKSRPMLSQPPTTGMVAKASDMVLEFEPPPSPARH